MKKLLKQSSILCAAVALGLMLCAPRAEASNITYDSKADGLKLNVSILEPVVPLFLYISAGLPLNELFSANSFLAVGQKRTVGLTAIFLFFGIPIPIHAADLVVTVNSISDSAVNVNWSIKSGFPALIEDIPGGAIDIPFSGAEIKYQGLGTLAKPSGHDIDGAIQAGNGSTSYDITYNGADYAQGATLTEPTITEQIPFGNGTIPVQLTFSYTDLFVIRFTQCQVSFTMPGAQDPTNFTLPLLNGTYSFSATLPEPTLPQ